MLKAIWNFMAVLGCFCCAGVIFVVIMMMVDDARDKIKKKHQMTYTKYFTEEDADRNLNIGSLG